MRKNLILATSLLVAASAMAQQPQMKLPRPSPKGSLTQTVGVTDVTITYSRPGVKGRQVWGTLVPYDQVWRTGANEATTITVSDDVTVNGQKLAKGTYSLHTIPGKDQWTVIFNSVADQWGSYSYDKAKDVVRVTAKPEKAEFREWMGFEIPEMTTESARVVLRWENVAVPFTINTDTTNKALASIREALAAAPATDWRVPYRAATFAFENNVAMDDAQKWLDQSIKASETLPNLWLKARMLQKQGQKADAIRTAEQALGKATENDKDFAAEIRKQVDGWKK